MPRPCSALVLLTVLTLSPLASAKHDKGASAPEAEVERLEIAREHFQKGEQLAEAGSLEAALVELELAEVAHPSQMVTDAKQRIRAALDAKRASADGAPAVVVAAPAPPPARRPLRRFIAPIVLAPLAIGALVAGGALVGVVKSDVSRLEGSCAPACAPSQVDPLRAREAAGYGLIGAGAVLAVTDVVLWGVLGARRERAPVRAAAFATPTGGAISVGGSY